MAFFERFR